VPETAYFDIARHILLDRNERFRTQHIWIDQCHLPSTPQYTAVNCIPKSCTTDSEARRNSVVGTFPSFKEISLKLPLAVSKKVVDISGGWEEGDVERSKATLDLAVPRGFSVTAAEAYLPYRFYILPSSALLNQDAPVKSCKYVLNFKSGGAT
jgi:hypothetical protein